MKHTYRGNLFNHDSKVTLNSARTFLSKASLLGTLLGMDSKGDASPRAAQGKVSLLG